MNEVDRAALEAAIAQRDFDAALEIMDIKADAPFVWPEVYEKLTPSQTFKRVKGIKGAPVCMKGSRYIVRKKYGSDAKFAWAAMERWLRLFKVTEIDREAHIFLLDDAWPRFRRKFCSSFHGSQHEKFNKYVGFVFVQGKMVPIRRDRIAELERGLRLIEKLDKLAA